MCVWVIHIWLRPQGRAETGEDENDHDKFAEVAQKTADADEEEPNPREIFGLWQNNTNCRP